jgi:hypothetical protein
VISDEKRCYLTEGIVQNKDNFFGMKTDRLNRQKGLTLGLPSQSMQIHVLYTRKRKLVLETNVRTCVVSR